MTEKQKLGFPIQGRIDELNPFEDGYLRHELDFYGNMDEWDGETARIRPVGGHFHRVDDFFNKNMRETPVVPSLEVLVPSGDWELAMSLSFMEMQSSWLPIVQAEGVCATAGLGLGYYALRVIEKEEVEKLLIFERNEEVVQAFQDRFCDREGYGKCEFIIGSAREEFRGYNVDHVFMDIYHTLLPDELIPDAALFLDNNNIYNYHPWGIEKVVLDAVNLGVMDAEQIPWGMRSLYKMWMLAPVSDDEEDDTTMDQLYDIGADADYCKRALTALSEGDQDWAEELHFPVTEPKPWIPS